MAMFMASTVFFSTALFSTRLTHPIPYSTSHPVCLKIFSCCPANLGDLFSRYRLLDAYSWASISLSE